MCTPQAEKVTTDGPVAEYRDKGFIAGVPATAE